MIRWTGARDRIAIGDIAANLRQIPVCPDSLEYEEIGAADNLRGRVVRLFFWLIRWWKP